MDLFGVSSSIRIGFLAISCYISERNKMVLIPSLLIPLKQPGLQLLQGYGTLKLPESPRPNGPARHLPLSAAAGSVRLAAGRCQSPWGRPRWPNEAHGSPRWWSQGVRMSIGLRGTMSKLKMLKHWTWSHLPHDSVQIRGRIGAAGLKQVVMCKPQGRQGSLLPETEPKDRPQFPYPTRDVARCMKQLGFPNKTKTGTPDSTEHLPGRR